MHQLGRKVKTGGENYKAVWEGGKLDLVSITLSGMILCKVQCWGMTSIQLSFSKCLCNIVRYWRVGNISRGERLPSLPGIYESDESLPGTLNCRISVGEKFNVENNWCKLRSLSSQGGKIAGQDPGSFPKSSLGNIRPTPYILELRTIVA